MYHKQQGFLPSLLFSVGFVLLAGSLVIPFVDIIYLNLGIHAEFERNPSTVIARIVLFPTIGGTIALQLMNFFPALKLHKEGLEIGYTPFFKSMICWDQIRGLGKISDSLLFENAYALVLKTEEHRKGPQIFIRIFHWAQGYIIGERSPVIIISAKMESVLKELKEHTEIIN